LKQTRFFAIFVRSGFIRGIQVKRGKNAKAKAKNGRCIDSCGGVVEFIETS